MARLVKRDNTRRDEILQLSQRLVYVKGFEAMTIQDILDGLQISKGSFYHYFDSKQALLEAMIDQMTGQIEKVFVPIVEDPDLSALEKFHNVFNTIASWKTAQKDYILQLMHGWYRDENAVIRQKVTMASLQMASPYFSRIIQQGIEEGVFSNLCPETVGEVIMALMQSVGEKVARLMLSASPSTPLDSDQIEKTVIVYKDAMEKILGAKTGTLCLFDMELIKAWVSTIENGNQANRSGL